AQPGRDGGPQAVALTGSQRDLRARRAFSRTTRPLRPRLSRCLNRPERALAERAGGFMAGMRTTGGANGPGTVSLVGAGPGDPGLLTRRAIARLRAADLVLYDALIDERILRYARKAQRFYVGKRAGRHAMTQEAIHTLMIRAARR